MIRADDQAHNVACTYFIYVLKKRVIYLICALHIYKCRRHIYKKIIQ